MRMFLISDNTDTLTGMRLAGVDGVLAHTHSEVVAALKKLEGDGDIGIVLVTEKLSEAYPELFFDIKMSPQTPLLVNIPDRHGTSLSSSSIARYIKESVGIRI